MPDEDLIESAPRPQSGFRRRAGAALHGRWGVVAVLIVGLVAGSVGGYLVGSNRPQLAGLGSPYFGFLPGTGFDYTELQFDENYGRPPLPTLTPADLVALGERVGAEVHILSAQSAVPVLCGTSLGQPGSTTLGQPDNTAVEYPSTVFNVADGRVVELLWPHPDAEAASRTLHTLVFQAQLCPELPDYQAMVRSSGVLTGLGDEYVVLDREPMNPDAQGALFATTALVRVGADLIEITVAAEDQAVPEAENRCLLIAAVAVQVASGG